MNAELRVTLSPVIEANPLDASKKRQKANAVCPNFMFNAAWQIAKCYVTFLWKDYFNHSTNGTVEMNYV